MGICILSCLFLTVWFDVNVVWLCVLFSCYHSLCENGTLCRSLYGGKHWKWVEVCKWAQRLMWRMFDKFPLKVCVWSGSECIFYLLWIKGKTEIKLNLTRYNILFTVTSLWLYVNWTANTLIHMYRDLGHGQPRFSSESRLESLMEKLKMLGGLAKINHWNCCTTALILKRIIFTLLARNGPSHKEI